MSMYERQTMISFPPRRALLATLLFVGPFSLQNAPAQTPDDAQKTICRQQNQGAICGALVLEFSGRKALEGENPTLPLDNPMMDTGAVTGKLAPRALESQFSTGLKNLSVQALQAAIQTVSTTGSVTQVGSSASSSGSTNLVAKPTVSDFLSLASESGAFTDTANGSSMTLQANVLGLSKYFSSVPVFQRVSSRVADAVQPLTVGVTMNVAQASVSSASTSGTANAATPSSIAAVFVPSNNTSFSGITVSYAIYRKYSPQDKNFQTKWADALNTNQAALTAASSSVAAAVNKLTPPDVVQQMMDKLTVQIAKWHTDGATAERAGDFDGFVKAYTVYQEAVLSLIMEGKDAPADVLTLKQAEDAFTAATYTVLDAARGKPLATLSYSYSTPAQTPPVHQAAAAVSYVFVGKPNLKTGTGSFSSGIQITGNFTASIYANLPTGAAYGRFRDVQLSSEIDKPFGGTLAAPRGVVSFAGYGQYQYDPTVLNISSGNLAPGTNITLPSNAQVLLGTSGWLGVVQGKVVFNLTKGLSLPIAIKWSNKTDLLQGNDVRGQFGLSYDLSALSSLLGSH